MTTPGEIGNRDLAAVGGLRARQPRPLPRARRLAARARRRHGACATRATSTRAAARASRSGSCPPTRSPRATPTRRARSSRAPRARTTATRLLHEVRGGEAPVSDDRARPTHGDVTRRPAQRSPRSSRAPASRAPGTRRLADVARVRAAARRRRAHARPAARRVDRPRARARGGRRARQHRARPARPRPLAAALRRHARRAAARTTSPTGATSPSSAAPGSSSSRTATSRTRSRGSSSASVYQFELYSRAQRVDRRDARGDRREGGEGGRLPPRPRRAVDAAPRRRHRRVAPPHDPRGRRHLAVRRRAVPRRRRSSSGSPRGRRGAARRRCAPRSTRSIAAVFAEAELERPTGRTAFVASGGGRDGSTLEHLGPLLAEMQVLARAASGGDHGDRGAAEAPSPADARRPGRAARVGGRRDRDRPRGAGAHDRGPRRAARRSRSTTTAPCRDDHADLLADAPRSTRCATTSCSRSRQPATPTSTCDLVLAPAWTTDWMSETASSKLARVRHRSADRARRGRGSGPIRLQLAREVPALRLARHPRALPLRLDVVQGALRVPRLPRALRLLQGALMAARNLGSTAIPRPPDADARSPRRSSRAPSAASTSRSGTAPGSTRSRSPRCARSPTTPSRSPSRCPSELRRRVRLPAPASTSRCATELDGHERAPQLLDLPAARRRGSAHRVAIKRDLGGRVLDLGERASCRPATTLDVMSPQGTFTSTLADARRRSTSPASPRARASRRSWRSPHTVLARSDDVAVHARLHEPLDDST